MYLKKLKQSVKIGLYNLENRQKWVKKILSECENGKTILDVGAGECQYKKYCSHLVYSSQDFNQYEGEGNNIGLQTDTWDVSQIDIVSDITSIPVPNESFDIILCTEVLEHVPDPIAAINEMNRILKKGGIMIITSPFCSLTQFAPYHFCDGFNSYFYNYHLKERLNYQNIQIDYNGNYFEYISQELYRLPTIVKSYTSTQPFFVKIFSKILIRLLGIINLKHNNSHDLLCFGYHVKAIK
jgi:ubiquinone/menaquinone biosynthesis C-methylase UbiE